MASPVEPPVEAASRFEVEVVQFASIHPVTKIVVVACELAFSEIPDFR